MGDVVDRCPRWKCQEISEGLFPHIAKPRQTYDKKREEHGRPPPAPWTPLFRLQLNRLEVRTCTPFGSQDYGKVTNEEFLV